MLFRGDESPYSTSRGSCLEPKDLSESLHLNQISIFMSGRFKHWVGNQYNLNCSGCIPAQMGLSPDPLKLPQIAFRVCFFFLPSLCFLASCGACQKKKKKNCATASHHFYSLPHSLTVTPVAFFCLCLTVLTRHRDSGSSGDEAAEVARQRKEERERTSVCREDGTGSIILRSAYVCLSVTVHGRGSLMFCVSVCLYVCVCVRVPVVAVEEGRKRHQGRSVRWREWACRLGNVTLGRFVGFDPGKLMQNPSASIWFGKTLGADLSLNNNYWVYINFLPYSLPQESWSPPLASWG